ncbi:hypothetical protein, partial [Acetomicrobium sp. S15 = DSM 107314]|uniref:hypothetical protein n=1 Tax=Acetomicrobium sp. S15 = DSM 107314 TaxID=2529858 RepID=UPI001E304B74
GGDLMVILDDQQLFQSGLGLFQLSLCEVQTSFFYLILSLRLGGLRMWLSSWPGGAAGRLPL